VRFEDLCSRPGAALTAVSDKLGLALDLSRLRGSFERIRSDRLGLFREFVGSGRLPKEQLETIIRTAGERVPLAAE
jgi:hypothetical protein